MPFIEVSKMLLKQEFVRLATNEKNNFSKLCQTYNISRQSGYKWLNRYQAQGESGLLELSRRAQNSPMATAPVVIDFIVKTRINHPCWGAKKIQRILQNNAFDGVPSPVTIHKILQKNNLICPELSAQSKPIQRFEYSQPNELWQMDFKGDFPIAPGLRCHPLTILDDHSRFSLCVGSCANQKRITVEQQLKKTFHQYGLPQRFLIDNGSPWATVETENRLTKLSVWLIELGIKVIFCRPRRPQTKGKDERFNRTLKDEVISKYSIRSLRHAQDLFESWREIYNGQRPHQALNYDTPSQHYAISSRKFYDKIEPVEYESSDIVKRVDARGCISHKTARIFVGRAFTSKQVALRKFPDQLGFNVFFYSQIIKKIDSKPL